MLHVTPSLGNDVGLHPQEPCAVQLLVFAIVDNRYIDIGLFVRTKRRLDVDLDEFDVAEAGLERFLGDLANPALANFGLLRRPSLEQYMCGKTTTVLDFCLLKQADRFLRSINCRQRVQPVVVSAFKRVVHSVPRGLQSDESVREIVDCRRKFSHRLLV